MIKASIFDKKLSVENVTISDSVKFDTVKFQFPEKWEKYEKTAVFKTDDGTKINVVLDKENELCLSDCECYIPHEVLKSPCFFLSVFGVFGDSVATTTQAKVKVLKSGYIKGNKPENPTPTEYEQILNIVNQTKEIAQSVRDDADNGLFKGEKGDKGDKGDSTADIIFDSIMDDELSDTSENPVKNSAIKAYADSLKKASDDLLDKSIQQIQKSLEDLNDSIEKAKSQALLEAHPIGSYYWSDNPTNPSQLFGGNWEQIKDKFVLAVGDENTAADLSGGAKTVQLTAENLPAHYHKIPTGNTTDGNQPYFTADGATGATSGTERYTFTSTSYNNTEEKKATRADSFSIMPPYITAYCWKRLAD